MRILRIEDSRGQGPFCSELDDHRYLDGWGYVSAHPGPWEEFGTNWYSFRPIGGIGDLRFGFEDDQQALEWFSNREIIKALDRQGSRLSVYDVPSEAMRVGRNQVVFDLSLARKVEQQLLTGWFGRMLPMDISCSL